MNRITMAEASEIKADSDELGDNIVIDGSISALLGIESLMIEKGDSTTSEDIDNFVKFICTKAEERGLVVRRKDRGNEGREMDRDRREDVKSYGMGSSNR
tara:strand:- start:1673 stop:1972 length:300 start_codon:yes stop_codon:yes gene_type:complete